MPDEGISSVTERYGRIYIYLHPNSTMEEDKVVLDRKSFEALAVDSRVRILKSLKQRRKTLSEIAQEMGMSVSGVKEHLETLEGADLVKKMDDGHKWKYYELTKKGSDLVAPKELRVWVVLSISVIALLISAFAILPSLQTTYDASGNAPQPFLAGANPNGGVQTTSAVMQVKTTADENISATNPQRTMNSVVGASSQTEVGTGTQAPASIEATQDDSIPMLVGGISILTMLACLGILTVNRLKRS